ncbi:calcium-binding protein [Streptomyces sp. SID486]|uniref:calcium-binding protein n=1 Tax=unclassified Streptomyces TaxID=2593676 RepID=UPI00136EAB9E|nr:MULTISPECIES: calcium-binding protein [unclassified Streptomyces]MYW42721.1 calcium-binding protein [Streptomyces sp. SID161]MYY00277.1 calcium-binding protein [Streptomyces sp. SID486]
MRIRASVAAVGGALALTALAVPAAQADGADGDVRITKVVVDGDNKVSVGTSGAVTVKVSVTATDDSGIAGADMFDLYGPADGFAMTGKPVCAKVDATTSTCTASVKIDPRTDYLSDASAGTWYVSAWIDAKDGNYVWKEKAAAFSFQRTSKLTADAAPEPVKKGRTLTVTGKLTRADWETLKYGGYGSRSVQLQFRKKTAGAYTTLKTVKADARGNLKTTTTASVDGYYRFVFAGNSTASAVNAAGDLVDVR